MMRSRSRSRSRQMPAYRRSRSRSPYNARNKAHHYDNYGARDKPQGRERHSRWRRDDYRNQRSRNFSPQRSPKLLKHRSRSLSPHLTHSRQTPEQKRVYDYDARDQSPMMLRSPNRRNHSSYQEDYSRRSMSPQRLTVEAIPKEPKIFRGPEGTIVDLNELKKITVDIRRTLPRGVLPITHGPLRYSFKPEELVIVRRPGEGSRPIFDRIELKQHPGEERVIKLSEEETLRNHISPPRIRESFTPPIAYHDGRQSKEDTESDLRYRLMEKKNNDDVKERLNNDPNFVPQGRYYFEHDNRERLGRGGGRGFRSNRGYGGNRGHFRGNHRDPFRGSFRAGKQRSPDWKHDMYESIDDAKPSSTTLI